MMKYWKKIDDILNTNGTNEIECPLHTQGNHHLIHGFYAQNEDRLDSSSPQYVPLHRVLNFNHPSQLTIMHLITPNM